MKKLFIIISSVVFLFSCSSNNNDIIATTIKEKNLEKLKTLTTNQFDQNYRDNENKSFLELAKNTKNQSIINVINYGLNYKTFTELEGKWKCLETNKKKYELIIEIKANKEDFILIERIIFEPKPTGLDRMLEIYTGWSKINSSENGQLKSYTYFGKELVMIKQFENKNGKWYVSMIDRTRRSDKADYYELIKI